MASNEICASCSCSLKNVELLGESNVYSPSGIGYDLCGPCLEIEDRIIEETGHNNIPSLIKGYESTLRNS